MHILLVHQYFLEDDEGGGGRWNENSRIWTEAGHQVTVLAGMDHYMSPGKSYSGQLFARKTNTNGVRVIRCYVSENNGRHFLGRILGYFTFALSSCFAGIFYAGNRYDMIVVSSPPLFIGITGLFLSWIKRVPFLFEVRDLWPESAIDAGVLNNKWLIRAAYWFEKHLYKKAILINVLTPAFKKNLISKKQVPLGKIMMIPNAADFSLTVQVEQDFDIERFKRENNLENRFIITYVGAHGIANHLIQILETAERLLDTNVTFLLIGDGSQKADLVAEAKKRQLNNVIFVGFLPKPKVFKYILASDMGTSVLKKTETFKTVYSNKTFDYFACKKPILMVIDGVSRKLVEDADAGIFVEPENPADFAEKIRFCLAHPELINLWGQNGYAYAKINFDREALAVGYLNRIKDIMNHIEKF